jgi:sulfatase modifying factor 1
MNAPMTIKQYVSQMSKVQGGRFMMGRTYVIEDPYGMSKNELPAHPVDISTFRLGTTPVTVGMWREYVRSNKRISMPKAPDWGWIDDHPMVRISWEDIMGETGTGGYCAWATQATGIKLLLPTEAQFEYAAKGGSRDLKYPWGDSFDPNMLWCSESRNSGPGRTAPVVRSEKFHKNVYGISDLAGNVAEWCYDSFADYGPLKRDRLGYQIVPANPKMIGSGKWFARRRILRGGSWLGFIPDFFRCSFRDQEYPDARNSVFGLRLATAA